MHPLLLIQTGEAPAAVSTRLGGFAERFRNAMRLEPAQLRVVRVDNGEFLPRLHEVAGAVITGSAAMVTDHSDWSERTANWIRTATHAEMPLFGVCFGHQLMAHALGGTVGWLPAGRQMGTGRVTRTDSRPSAADAWLEGLPHAFPAQTSFRQAVLTPPPDAEVLGYSDHDPHHALRYACAAVSTQFHPEFSADYMRAYIGARADVLRAEGLDPDLLAAKVQDTEDARALLQRFAHAALERRNVAAT